MPGKAGKETTMTLERLKFVKNIDDTDWAYKTWQRGSQQQLNWAKGNETNANKASLGDRILLEQKPDHIQESRVTHLVEVVSHASETIDAGDWGVIRRVSVIWVADFAHEPFIPKAKDVFGWKRQRHQGTNLVELENIKDGKVLQTWQSLAIFQRHVAGMLGLIEELV